jgi:D-glycero-D-manno-heptose 1,7-bisphosphate phosphatase
MVGKKVLFVDRDGIINKMVLQKDGGFDSPQEVGQVKLVEGIEKIFKWLNARGIPIIEVSNQPGVAKGKMSVETLDAVEDRVHELLKTEGVHIDKVYRCLHHPQAAVAKWKVNCDCRKPNAGLLLQAIRDLGIDAKESVILGDNVSDMEAGKKVGVKTILFFHKDDVPSKVTMNEHYRDADYRVTSHDEVMPIFIKLFS